MQSTEVLELCRESGAMLEGHFELSSGLHSDRYVQCARLLMEPRRAERVAAAFAQRLGNARGGIEVVVGPALGAVVWAHEVARALGLRALFTERVDGEMCLRRGFELGAGERALVVEDALTTGRSARETIAVVEATGARVVHVGAIVDRSGGGRPFAREGLPFTALAEVRAQTWKPEECPLCARGEGAVKPGSRPRGRVGGPTA